MKWKIFKTKSGEVKAELSIMNSFQKSMEEFFPRALISEEMNSSLKRQMDKLMEEYLRDHLPDLLKKINLDHVTRMAEIHAGKQLAKQWHDPGSRWRDEK